MEALGRRVENGMMMVVLERYEDYEYKREINLEAKKRAEAYLWKDLFNVNIGSDKFNTAQKYWLVIPPKFSYKKEYNFVDSSEIFHDNELLKKQIKIELDRLNLLPII